ncbi:F0F1 ATP synthase subunit B' [Helicobacter cholecystus]|uniref:ATP synthase subunit b n=1 Tax=Helicobacter cholecystus TaxID=45498 RepID=A0A3D8ITV1_9HELI|nr:F0F1 ATP synthase subunit B' [Helicobacter cholecystus]RDU68719.1 F0F1 ATP synthase subunit B' [Helicobacter cholecystus]VEJ26195.1 F0F1 ATP synthase subunit B' [Helicobacter cholecystus]
MSLDLNPFLMLLVFVTFLLLIFILNIWLYRPMLAFMQQRERLLGENAQGIEEKKAEIQRLKAQIEQVLMEAKDEAKQIRDLATSQAQALYDEKFEKTKAELDLRYLTSLNELKEKQVVIRSELEKTQNALNTEVKVKFTSLGEIQ